MRSSESNNKVLSVASAVLNSKQAGLLAIKWTVNRCRTIQDL